ncbi:MAG TPA: hypothetical protein VFC04_06620 [Actinomycetota bacterium]|nr:hypothetical protein [Actinomycetota bacterium]
MRRIWRGALTALLVAGLVVGAGALAPLASRASGGRTDGPASAARTIGRLRFHEQMLKLWEDHVTWTRLFIVSFAAGLPDQEQAAERLLQNQADIGEAIKPFYGAAAASQLLSLLRQHILTAVDVLTAAKSGDQTGLQTALKAWYANAREIADFLHAANPRNWSKADMREMMKAHLDLTLREASDRLAGNYAADVADYDAVVREIVKMANMLANGIIAQFPERFSSV